MPRYDFQFTNGSPATRSARSLKAFKTMCLGEFGAVPEDIRYSHRQKLTKVLIQEELSQARDRFNSLYEAAYNADNRDERDSLTRQAEAAELLSEALQRLVDLGRPSLLHEYSCGRMDAAAVFVAANDLTKARDAYRGSLRDQDIEAAAVRAGAVTAEQAAAEGLDLARQRADADNLIADAAALPRTTAADAFADLENVEPGVNDAGEAVPPSDGESDEELEAVYEAAKDRDWRNRYPEGYVLPPANGRCELCGAEADLLDKPTETGDSRYWSCPACSDLSAYDRDSLPFPGGERPQQDERYLTGYGTKDNPFKAVEAVTYADLGVPEPESSAQTDLLLGTEGGKAHEARLALRTATGALDDAVEALRSLFPESEWVEDARELQAKARELQAQFALAFPEA